MDLSLPDVEPGTIYRGYLDVVDQLPTGAPERIPLIIAEGVEDGPTLWLTGAIHGDEATGMAVCLDVMADALPGHLAGRVVALPNLNPAGLRRHSRTSYYKDEDPNRLFPDVEYVASDEGPTEFTTGTRPPSQQEIICRRLFDLFADDADVLLDMHTASSGAYPFLIRDRVLYDRELGRTEAEARVLADEVETLSSVFGLPEMLEYVPEEYLDQNLQRSTAGAALNQAGIPSLTVELGAHGTVSDRWRTYGVAGTYRVMAHMGMVDDAARAFPEELGSLPAPLELPKTEGKRTAEDIEFPVRRHVGPHTPTPGIVRHRVDSGDVVEAGDVVAEIVPPNGDPDGVREVRADHTGWIIQRFDGVARYENDPVASMAVEDDHPRIGTPADE